MVIASPPSSPPADSRAQHRLLPQPQLPPPLTPRRWPSRRRPLGGRPSASADWRASRNERLRRMSGGSAARLRPRRTEAATAEARGRRRPRTQAATRKKKRRRPRRRFRGRCRIQRRRRRHKRSRKVSQGQWQETGRQRGKINLTRFLLGFFFLKVFPFPLLSFIDSTRNHGISRYRIGCVSPCGMCYKVPFKWVVPDMGCQERVRVRWCILCVRIEYL